LIRRHHIVSVGLIAVLFGLGWWVGRGSATGASDLYKNLDVFVEVLHKVEQTYVDPVEPRTLVEGALKGMLKDLDPYSQYLDRESWDNLQATTQGSFGGIGIVVSVRDHFPTVISPIEGSPAWRVGLRSGDVIVRIEGRSSAGLAVEEVASRLRGPIGTRVQVAVRREGEAGEHEYTIERQTIVTRSVPYAFVAKDHIGYLRLSNFSEKSGSEVRAALARLRAQGARALVLDLRSNPGGLLDQAVDVAEQFVKPSALIVFTRGRASNQSNRYYSSEKQPELGWPLVVLVDSGSASASEIVAGALQDLDRALVLGETSFGKGSVQSVFPLRGHRSALKLTTARYYTPSGRSIHKATHDRPPQAEAEGDDEDDGAPPEAAPNPAPDSAAVRYRTAGGRVVFGGGGIRPDVVVVPDSLPPLTRRVETRGLAFRFANRWANTHPAWRPDAPLDEPLRRDFAAFLESEKVPFRSPELNDERVLLDRALRRELARRVAGDSAAVRVALEGDPVLARALAILSRAHTAREVFAAVPSVGHGTGPKSER
jgi:carboxyl-terminal processing protease